MSSSRNPGEPATRRAAVGIDVNQQIAGGTAPARLPCDHKTFAWLVNHAHAHHTAKRGGTAIELTLDEAAAVSKERSVDLVALDEALTRLASLDPQQSRTVELRFFGGLTIEETAEVLGISPATVKREWTMAKAWLHCVLTKTVTSDE